MKEIKQTDIETAIRSVATTALKNEQYFCELDSFAGDADFGVSLASGFRVVEQDWKDLDRSSIGAFLLKISMIITRNVGGCSGPIWGTGFMPDTRHRARRREQGRGPARSAASGDGDGERGDRAHEAVGREARPAAVHGRTQREHAGSGYRRDRDDAQRHLRQVRRAGAEQGPLINRSNPGESQ